MPWLRLLCAHLLWRRHFSISEFFTIAFVLDKGHWDIFPSKYFDFPPSEPFHYCSILNFLSSVWCCKNYAIYSVVKCHTSILPIPLNLWTVVYVDGSHVWYKTLVITRKACNSIVTSERSEVPLGIRQLPNKISTPKARYTG
jgi:hypothetical protein